MDIETFMKARLIALAGAAAVFTSPSRADDIVMRPMPVQFRGMPFDPALLAPLVGGLIRRPPPPPGYYDDAPMPLPLPPQPRQMQGGDAPRGCILRPINPTRTQFVCDLNGPARPPAPAPLPRDRNAAPYIPAPRRAQPSANSAANVEVGTEHAVAIAESCVGHWDRYRCAIDTADAVDGVGRDYAASLKTGGHALEATAIRQACNVTVTDEQRKMPIENADPAIVAHARNQRAGELQACWDAMLKASQSGIKPDRLQARLVDTSRQCLKDDDASRANCTRLEQELRANIPSHP